VIDDEADRPAARPGDAGQVGARDGLPGADQIQDDLPVDFTRGAAVGDPHWFGMRTLHAMIVPWTNNMRASPAMVKWPAPSSTAKSAKDRLDTPHIHGILSRVKTNSVLAHAVNRVGEML